MKRPDFLVSHLFEAMLFVVAVSVSSACLAIPYSKCKPIAAPVTGCECPLGGDEVDRCKGTLPKEGATLYGDVACQTDPTTSCTPVTTNDANPCGIVVMCPCVKCSAVFVDTSLTCDCVDHPEKPPCTHRWGQCTYPP